MRQMWNGQPVGPGFMCTGKVSAITEKSGNLEFRVDTDGVLRTIVLSKSAAHIRVTEQGITITEVETDA